MTGAGTGPVTTRSTSPSASSSRSCSASTLGVIGVPRRRRPAKWDSPWASQYSRVNFHFPPIAANAAAIGQPGRGLGRAGEGLPIGAFLFMVVLRRIVGVVNLRTVPHRRILVAFLAVLTFTAPASAAGDTAAAGDGQRDFDWEIGAWH